MWLRFKRDARIALMASQGWDTHFDQARRLNTLLGELSQGLLTLLQGIASAWPRTADLVVSEFGRTIAENASRGTVHGTGGLPLLEGRDVRPPITPRATLKQC